MSHISPCHWTLKLRLTPESADKLIDKLTKSRKFNFTWKIVTDHHNRQAARLKIGSIWGSNLKDLADILESSEELPEEDDSPTEPTMSGTSEKSTDLKKA